MTFCEDLSRLKPVIRQAVSNRPEVAELVFEDTTVSLVFIKGKKEGPAVWLQAALHGDECDGSAALLRLIPMLEKHLLNGTVCLLPVANPTAFAAGRLASPHDGKNLNRMGTDESGTYSARYFRWLADLISDNADVMADLHGGGAFLDVLSFALIPGGSEDNLNKSQLLCKGLELDAVAEIPERGELINELNKRGLKTILLENGGGSAVSEACVEKHLRNVLRILNNLGMLDGAFLNKDDSPGQKEGREDDMIGISAATAKPVHIRREYDFYFEQDGILSTKTRVGTLLKKGDAVYGVTDLKTFEETVFRCPFDKAYLLSIHNTARVTKGAYAAYLGTEE